MDTSRLPTYRSSYLLRFHPYPRARLSTRERLMAATAGHASYDSLRLDALLDLNDVSFALTQAIHGDVELRQRRRSVSSLVIDLALLCVKRSPQGDCSNPELVPAKQ